MTDLSAALRSFVRLRGSDYLRDPNVTSIGIGNKVRGGERTDEVCVQFTVGAKVEPEALGDLATSPLPESIEIAGVSVPTDVVERTYRPAFRVVEASPPEPRKSRMDPVRPGVSIGHPRITCGTVGAVVYDRETGAPYLLSNWHVLHGLDGELGDTVVQPGTHDDNRTEQNAVGVLARSHLGVAGDCAVVSVSGRGIDPSVLDLDVVPSELGDPELGDAVVKSGRTTGVTHGIVRRVDVLAKLDYGGDIGTREIGGLEIGPDPDRRAADGEISRGGDSGAAWLVAADGKPTGVLAGLHFAGEGGGDPDEHALACLPKSVFDKLGITLDRPEVAETAIGYDAEFLGVKVPVPGLDAGASAVVLDGSTTIDYTHFSLALSSVRRFAFWVAWNIDGSGLRKLPRSGIAFVKDPRLPADTQHGDELYRGNRLDRGHLARRADLLWGSAEEADRANRDSFYFTNITPQLDAFNQAARNGLWGRLEDALFEDVEVDDLRVSVVAGPVFGADDRVYRGVAVPREFWKVIAHTVGGELRASAFLLTQNLDRLETLDLDEFAVYQLPVAEVGARTGLNFPTALTDADTAPPRPEADTPPHPLTGPADIRWTP
ncbi:DNA/RNA non-specific endonuclease [Actinokineospora sp. UTMC 2448]|uniref:DNA/RNA non-specific endonuclease n=1 Tax=Actinokineospora sp. UTMC 2448 TaxID=2268449 RepID=UPI002164EAA0|nr:DNA/RNA non-specific endonuclease [Actinokineospora sp. UTMC 2448]UVS78982.1 Nuclease precursor [Actinokineospora sp. UTMC 2448]